MAIIRLQRLSKTYVPGQAPAVRHLSLEVREGEVLALLGPSGCGKTTVLRLIAGFEQPDSGTIEINGDLVADGRTFIPPEKRGVGMVFQDFALFPHLTVAENVAFGLHRLSAAARKGRVQQVLEMVELLALQGRYPNELSGGQQQRVALARSLAPGPWVILLDEPLSNLDSDMRIQMRHDLHRILQDSGTTTIFVTHDQEEAFQVAGRVGVLYQGSLEQTASPEELYHYPTSRFVADFVGLADFLPGQVQPEGIVTEIGSFPNPQGLAWGCSLELMMRPDDIHLLPHPDGLGVVVDRQFRGSDNLYTVRLPSGRLLHSSQGSTVLLKPQSRVAIQVNLSHIVTFPHEPPGRPPSPQLANASATTPLDPNPAQRSALAWQRAPRIYP